MSEICNSPLYVVVYDIFGQTELPYKGITATNGCLLRPLFNKFDQVVPGSVGEAICPPYTHGTLDTRSPVVAGMAANQCS